MTDYLGPLALGTSGTYTLLKWEPSSGNSANIEVIVRATSGDTLAAALEALAAQLYFGNTYVHYWPGVTNPVTFSVIGAGPMKQDDLVSWPVFWQKVAFTLNLAANPAGALTTLYSAQHVDTPASVALSALLGTNPTSLDVTIDDDAGTDMHSVLAALAPTALSDAKWLVLASALTWTTMSNGTGADMWGNSSRYTTSASVQTAPLDTSQYPAGKYRLYGRPKQAAGTGYVKDSQNDTWVAVTRTTPHLVVIGDLDLPVSDTAPGVASNLTLSVKSDGTNRFDINAYLVVPLEYGFFSWHHATATTEIVKLDVGPSGIFMDGVTDMTYFAGGILTPRVLAAHTGTLIATASPTGNNWPADWGRTDSSDVTADTSRFKIATTTGSKYAWQGATMPGRPLIVPGAWYEFAYTRQVTARSAGYAFMGVDWYDIDGNAVLFQTLNYVSTTDASPVATAMYAKAPMYAARARFRVGGGPGANLTAYYSACAVRRCPMRLIVVAEDAAGALTSYLHPVHLTVKYQPRYEVAR